MKSDMILLLGDERLHQPSAPVAQAELPQMMKTVQDLHDILFEFKARYGAFRGIASPQIGVMKRLIYIHIDRPLVVFNPELVQKSGEMFEMWDDCMCFPNLLVKLQRHKSCLLRYRDEHWQPQELHAEDALSELLQHEYDHLEGVLAIDRALDGRSFKWRKEIPVKK